MKNIKNLVAVLCLLSTFYSGSATAERLSKAEGLAILSEIKNTPFSLSKTESKVVCYQVGAFIEKVQPKLLKFDKKDIDGINQDNAFEILSDMHSALVSMAEQCGWDLLIGIPKRDANEAHASTLDIQMAVSAIKAQAEKLSTLINK